jgi:hypothetical protein
MSYEVVTDDLRAHVSHLEGLMDRVQTATQAAQSVSMDEQAYGLICAFLPAIINPMAEKGAQAMTSASNALGTTADNVNKAIAAYEDREQATAQPFTSTLDTEGGTSVGSGSPGDYVVGGPQMTGPGPMVMSGPVDGPMGMPLGPGMTGAPVGPPPFAQQAPAGPPVDPGLLPPTTATEPFQGVDTPVSTPAEPFRRVSTPTSIPAHEATAPEPFLRDSVPASAPVHLGLPADSSLRAAVEGYSREAEHVAK